MDLFVAVVAFSGILRLFLLRVIIIIIIIVIILRSLSSVGGQS